MKNKNPNAKDRNPPRIESSKILFLGFLKKPLVLASLFHAIQHEIFSLHFKFFYITIYQFMMHRHKRRCSCFQPTSFSPTQGDPFIFSMCVTVFKVTGMKSRALALSPGSFHHAPCFLEKNLVSPAPSSLP